MRLMLRTETFRELENARNALLIWFLILSFPSEQETESACCVSWGGMSIAETWQGVGREMRHCRGRRGLYKFNYLKMKRWLGWLHLLL